MKSKEGHDDIEFILEQLNRKKKIMIPSNPEGLL
jgi:hypothetical protein